MVIGFRYLVVLLFLIRLPTSVGFEKGLHSNVGIPSSHLFPREKFDGAHITILTSPSLPKKKSSQKAWQRWYDARKKLFHRDTSNQNCHRLFLSYGKLRCTNFSQNGEIASDGTRWKIPWDMQSQHNLCHSPYDDRKSRKDFHCTKFLIAICTRVMG